MHQSLFRYIGKYRRKQLFVTTLCALEIAFATLIPYLLGRLITMVESKRSFTLDSRNTKLGNWKR